VHQLHLVVAGLSGWLEQVTVSSLAIVPTASAMPMSCAARWSFANSYWALGTTFYLLGDDTLAYYWWGEAYGIVEGC
jgi:hypothetical protein